MLFLAGIFGERPKSGKEVVLATQRALEQQALERWRMQKEARIDQMARDGEALAPVAAALASPEMADRIAILEAAITGGLSAMDAARLNLQRAGADMTLMKGSRDDSPQRGALRILWHGGGNEFGRRLRQNASFDKSISAQRGKTIKHSSSARASLLFLPEAPS